MTLSKKDLEEVLAACVTLSAHVCSNCPVCEECPLKVSHVCVLANIAMWGEKKAKELGL